MIVTNFMETEDIVRLSKRDRVGRELSDRLTQDPSTNAVYGIAGIEGRLKDPRIAPLLEASPDMAPARHRMQLEQSVAEYKSELTGAVLGDVDKSVRGLADKGVAKYLLDSPLKPAKFGAVSDDWVKSYSAARDAYIFLNNKETEMPARVEAHVKAQVDSLKKDNFSSGLISGLIWVYQNRPQVAQEAVIQDAVRRVNEFGKKLDLAEGRNYISGRVKALKEKDQVAEAYRLGQALSG